MKNPFATQNNTGLIAAVLLGSAAAAAIAYLFLTDSGAAARGKFKKKAKAKARNLAAKAVSKKTGLPKKAVKALADHVI